MSTTIIERIPHCRALTASNEDYSAHFDSDRAALAFALENMYTIIVHADGTRRLYYFGRRDPKTMTNLHSVTQDQNKSAFRCTTFVIRLN